MRRVGDLGLEQGLCHRILLNRDLEGALLCRINSLIEQADYACLRASQNIRHEESEHHSCLSGDNGRLARIHHDGQDGRVGLWLGDVDN